MTTATIHAPQIKIAATYMRGGTSKGVFFRLQDLPNAAQVPGPARDTVARDPALPSAIIHEICKRALIPHVEHAQDSLHAHR